MANPNIVEKKSVFARFISYIRECYSELRYKVSWPTGKELSNSAVIVLIASLIMSAFIFFVDQAFEFIMRGIYRLII